MKISPVAHRAPLVDGYAVPPHNPADLARAPPPEQPSFDQVLRRLATEVDRGQAVVSHALRAGPDGDDNRSMIALQAGVYRYVEAIDLCTRLVDRAAGAVRTTLQSQ